MLGGMLAGSDECDGEWVTEGDERRAMRFYGMSSREAQEKHHEGLKDYIAAEGKCVEAPYKGPVREVLREIAGGLRSACAYVAQSGSRTFPSAAPSSAARVRTLRRSSESLNQLPKLLLAEHLHP